MIKYRFHGQIGTKTNIKCFVQKPQKWAYFLAFSSKCDVTNSPISSYLAISEGGLRKIWTTNYHRSFYKYSPLKVLGCKFTPKGVNTLKWFPVKDVILHPKILNDMFGKAQKLCNTKIPKKGVERMLSFLPCSKVTGYYLRKYVKHPLGVLTNLQNVVLSTT